MTDKDDVVNGDMEIPIVEILAELGEKVIEIRALKATIRGLVAKANKTQTQGVTTTT